MEKQAEQCRKLHGCIFFSVEDVEVLLDNNEEKFQQDLAMCEEGALVFNDDGTVLDPLHDEIEVIETTTTTDSFACVFCNFETRSSGLLELRMKSHYRIGAN